MARFIPYDQTGFNRVDARVARSAYASGVKWMDPRQRAKPKDWSTPEGIATALNLAKAVAENPIVDWASGEIEKSTRRSGGGSDVVLPAGYKESRDASQEALQQVLAAETAQTSRMTSPEMLDLYRRFAVDVGDVSALEVAASDHFMMMPDADSGKNMKEAERIQDIIDASKKAPIPAAAFQRSASELRQIQGMQQRAQVMSDEGTRLGEQPSTVVRSPDELVAFVSEQGRTQKDLAWALNEAKRFARGQKMSDRKRGVDPVRLLQKRLVDTFKKSNVGRMTEAQAARLRMQEDNYESLAQRRKDTTTLQGEKNKKLFNRWKQDSSRKDKDVDSKIELRDQRIERITEQIANAKTDGQRKFVADLARTLTSPRAGAAYPGVYSLFKKVAINSNWDLAEYLPGPDSIEYPRYKKQRKGTGSGTKGKPAKKPSGEDGGNSLGDYLGRWGSKLESAQSVFRDKNATDEELLNAATVVADIASQAGGYRTTSKLGKGQVRKGKDGVYFVHPDDVASLTSIKNRANVLKDQLEGSRSKRKSSSKAESAAEEAREKIASTQKRLIRSIKAHLKTMNAPPLASGWGRKVGGIPFPIKPDLQGSLKDEYTQTYKSLEAAYRALETSYQDHGAVKSEHSRGQ